jgi:hypothetical protein
MDSDKDNDDPKLSGLGVALVREVEVQQDNRKIESNSACLSFKTRLYMICKTSLVSAVVAQPGRALDLLRGEAEDRAVVSSNLTDGILHLFCGIYDYSSGVLNYPSRCSQMVFGIEYSR